MSLVLKKLTTDDARVMSHVGKLFADEVGLPYDFEKAESSIRAMMETFPHLALGLYDDEFLVGGLLGIKQEEWFSTRTVATEIFWFIAPPYRGGREGLMMFKTYNEWAGDAGRVCMGNFPYHPNSEAIHKLYTKYGFTLCEQTYERKSWQQ